jgi:hypothetical protein
MDGAAPEAPKEKTEKKPEEKTSPVVINPPGTASNSTHTTISFKAQKP